MIVSHFLRPYPDCPTNIYRILTPSLIYCIILFASQVLHFYSRIFFASVCFIPYSSHSLDCRKIRSLCEKGRKRWGKVEWINFEWASDRFCDGVQLSTLISKANEYLCIYARYNESVKSSHASCSQPSILHATFGHNFNIKRHSQMAMSYRWGRQRQMHYALCIRVTDLPYVDKQHSFVLFSDHVFKQSAVLISPLTEMLTRNSVWHVVFAIGPWRWLI